MSITLLKNVYFQASAIEFSSLLKSRYAAQYMQINVAGSTIFLPLELKFSEVTGYLYCFSLFFFFSSA